MTIVEALLATLSKVQKDETIAKHCTCRVSSAARITDLAEEIHSALTVYETSHHNQRTMDALFELAATCLVTSCQSNIGNGQTCDPVDP